MERRAPPLAAANDGAAPLDRFIARPPTDGLWSYDSLITERPEPEMQRAVAECISSALSRSCG